MQRDEIQTAFMNPTSDKSSEVSPKWWWHIAPIIMILVLCALGVRSLITKDSRYGWGTFGRQTIYTLKYEWEFSDGHRETYYPGDELRRDAYTLLTSIEQRNTRYGPGALPVWINGYCQYMWDYRPDGAVAFHTTLKYELDRSRREPISDAAQTAFFQYPLEVSP